MSNTSFRRLALSSHQLPPLCGPDNLKRGLAEAKPIRQTRLSLSLKLTICPRNFRRTGRRRRRVARTLGTRGRPAALCPLRDLRLARPPRRAAGLAETPSGGCRGWYNGPYPAAPCLPTRASERG